MTYQKLFEIKYNNKRFMLFLAEDNRTTFLEINDLGEYVYPDLEDFIALNKIYNCNNPFICYDIPRFKFKECVKQLKNGVLSLLTVVAIMNFIPTALASDANIEVKDTSIVLSYEPFYVADKYLRVPDTNSLEKVLGKVDITEELIINIINNNAKIPEDVKKITIEEFKRYYQEHPNANYRVFYENIKLLEVVVYTEEEYRNEFPKMPGSGANFDAAKHRISLIEGYQESILRHELAHTYQTLWIEYENKFITVVDYNSALKEGMTDIMSNSDDSRRGSYFVSARVVEYLMNISGYTFEEFSRFSIQGLLDKVHNLYPDIDVNYISQSLNAMVKTQINEATQIKEDSIYMYDEIFKLCLKNITPNSGYEPFLEFMPVLSGVKDKSLITTYFNKYNEELNRLGYYEPSKIKVIQENAQKYEKANDIIYCPDGDISFGYVCKDQDSNSYKVYKIEPDGSMIEVKYYGSLGINNFDMLKLKILIEYPNSVEEGIKKTVLDKKLLSPHLFMTIPIFLNGVLLKTMNINKLNIQVGKTKDNKIGYVLSRGNEIIFETASNMTDLSSPIAMSYYVREYSDYIEVLELSQVLNEDYLIGFQKAHKTFSNIEIIGNAISFIKSSGPSNIIPEIVESAEPIIELSNNSKSLGTYILKDLFITIGLTPDKDLGFIITNRQGEVIYQNNPEITETSIPIDFIRFIGSPLTKVSLNEVLNEAYVKNIQKETGCFNNISLQDDKLVVDATPTIMLKHIVNDREITQTYKLSKCRVYMGNGSYIVGGTSIMPEGFECEQIISLEEMFAFYNMLDKGVPTYVMTYDELDDMINNYLKDINTKER